MSVSSAKRPSFLLMSGALTVVTKLDLSPSMYVVKPVRATVTVTRHHLPGSMRSAVPSRLLAGAVPTTSPAASTNASPSEPDAGEARYSVALCGSSSRRISMLMV